MLNIKSINFKNAKGDSVLIDRSGMYRLTNTLVTSGLGSSSYTTKSYGQHGSTFHKSLYDEQEIELRFAIYGDGTELTYKNARRELSKKFAAHLGEGTLTVTLNDGSVYYKNVVVEVSPLFYTGFDNSNKRWQNVLVTLVCYNPFWVQDDITRTVGTSTNFTITNNGDVPTGFTYNFTTTSTSVTITKQSTGEYIKLTGLTGTTGVEIQTRYGKRYVKLNSTLNWASVESGSTFFMLDEGDNNITVTGTSTNASGKVTYNEKFISI